MSKLLYFGPSLASLHKDYAKAHTIDANAPLTSSTSLAMDASPARIWAAIADLRGWSVWAPGVEVRDFTEVRPDAPFRWRLNGISIRSTFAVVHPDRELSWTGTFMGFKAIDRQTLEAQDGGATRVTFEESLAGPFLPVLYSAAQLKANHARWLEALRAFVEKKA